MQGRQDKSGEFRRKSSKPPIVSYNGTGKMPSIPQRPPGRGERVSPPPTTPRVPRPKREEAQPKSLRKRILILGSVFLVCALLACLIGYVGTYFFNAVNVTSGASTTAGEFLGSMLVKNYPEAFQHLGVAITLREDLGQFTQKAQDADKCFGGIKDFKFVTESSVVDEKKQSYSYTITREKMPAPYEVRLTLQKQAEGATQDGPWKITDYGNMMTPGPTCPT